MSWLSINALFVPGAIAQEALAPRPLNVLLIAVDDLRPELGCYGRSYAPSPNIDRLADSGLVFTGHYVQVPTCGASRYALLTGRSPRKSKAFGNSVFYQGSTAIISQATEGAQTLPELFRRSGYYTASVGKLSHTMDGRVFGYDGSGDGRAEVPGAWTECGTPYGPWGRGWGAFFAYANGRHREDGSGRQDLTEFIAEEDEDLPDGLIAAHAVQTLEKLGQRERSFFLGVGFVKPHLPWVATRQDWQAVQALDLLSLTASEPKTWERTASAYWHASGEFQRYDRAELLEQTETVGTEEPQKGKALPKPEELAALRRAYLACVRYTDRQIGRVLDALERFELAESTIVILWGDHGWHLGESQIWGKHSPLERALRSPLIMRVPGITLAGTRSEALVESLDLYPTLIELCDPSFQLTEYPLDGHSLVPLMREPQAYVRKAALSYWRNAVSVRTQGFRLIGRPGDFKLSSADTWRDVELYAMDNGPDPLVNLATREPGIVRRLQALAEETW